jgi:predicted AlkP superfamily phosphohydrolase/phosphomutase
LAIVSRSRIGKQRVFVLGIDGVPFSLMTEFIEDGLLPNFEAILSQGCLRRMNSVFPCVSSVAWASYMTGMNPAKHGIFGFMDRDPQTMEMFVPTSTHMAAETLWEWLSSHGKRVVVVNVPGTYPPRPVNGVLVAGFLCPTLEKISYPREVADELKSMDYRIDIDSWKARESKDDFLVEVNEALDRRFEAALSLMDRVDWDFFQLHVMETDRINHFLLGHWKEADPVYGPLFLKFYQKLDRHVGAIIERIGKEAEVTILSDHGFCELKREVYLNHWLERQGFLKMAKESDSLRDMHRKSKAYTLFPGRLYVNLEGREATGSVEQGQTYEVTRQNLTEGLLEIRDPENGEPIIRKVLKREEVYHGPYLSSAPDLIAIPHNGYDLKGSFNKPVLTARSEIMGVHTYDDALLFVRNRDIEKDNNRFGIMDAYSVVLQLIGIPRPEGIDAENLIRETGEWRS